MKANRLKGKIVERGLNVEQVAEMIGIDRATFYRKLNDFNKFTVGDVDKIKKSLGLTTQETCDIFIG